MEVRAGIEAFGVANVNGELKGVAKEFLEASIAIFYPESWKGGLTISPTTQLESRTVWALGYDHKPYRAQSGIIHLAKGCGVISIVHPQYYDGDGRPTAKFYTDYSDTIYSKNDANRDINGPRYEWPRKDSLILTVGGSLPMWMKIHILGKDNAPENYQATYQISLDEKGDFSIAKIMKKL